MPRGLPKTITRRSHRCVFCLVFVPVAAIASDRVKYGSKAFVAEKMVIVTTHIDEPPASESRPDRPEGPASIACDSMTRLDRCGCAIAESDHSFVHEVGGVSFDARSTLTTVV